MADRRLPGRLATGEAIVLLLLARALRRALPLARWAAMVGRPRAPRTVLAGAPGEAERVIAVAVRRGARRLPIATSCLDQAIAGSWMLRRRGARAAVVIGLDAPRAGAGSHAWLVGPSGTVVVGGETMHLFRPVSQFGDVGQVDEESDARDRHSAP